MLPSMAPPNGDPCPVPGTASPSGRLDYLISVKIQERKCGVREKWRPVLTGTKLPSWVSAEMRYSSLLEGEGVPDTG